MSASGITGTGGVIVLKGLAEPQTQRFYQVIVK